MSRKEVPEVEVDSCLRCPMRGVSQAKYNYRRRCQLAGIEVSYSTIPRGCPLRGGPVQITLSHNARAFIEEHED